MKKLFKILLATVLAVGLCACGGDKKGGKLVIYTPNSDSLVTSVIPAFEEKYGITVEA